MDPLILTALLTPEAQERFDRLRREHFPASRNHLAALRAGLAREWMPWLSAQDRGKSDLHVTVQNKVEPAAARALHARLQATFEPETIRGTGLALWRYVGGPWEPVARYPFRVEPTAT